MPRPHKLENFPRMPLGVCGAVVLGVLDCSQPAKVAAPAPVCAAGAVQTCPCVGGAQAVQVCADDGSRWGGCVGCPTRSSSSADPSGARSSLGSSRVTASSALSGGSSLSPPRPSSGTAASLSSATSFQASSRVNPASSWARPSSSTASGGFSGASSATVALAVHAFPDAQGGGAAAVGGRGGAVMEVINLNDSGPGSLRECVNASGPRTCVFRVSGTLELATSLMVTQPYLTVAGQTAPGGGILISGKRKAAGTAVAIFANEVVWRYTRVRNGAALGCTGECGANFVAAGINIMVDHNSASWNVDEGFSAWSWDAGGTRNVTFSYNLTGEGLLGHATSMLMGGSGVAPSETTTNVDLHHNVMMNNTHRAPLLKNKSTRLVNNIMYNHAWHATQLANGIVTDIINNLYKQGPLYSGNHEISVHNGMPTEPHSPGEPSVYVAGNVGWSQPNAAGDPWLLVNENTFDNGNDLGVVRSAWRRSAPMPETEFPIVAEPVATLSANLIPIVGASRRLACDGSWIFNRDSVDQRLVTQYETNTGNNFIPASEEEVGGYPVLAAGTACPDADHDGMPDVWKQRTG